ncbi:hypothetical protein HAX54_024232, partial [Datura stramonium]|nr:hypothetical protein [Datura stramonium]
MTSGFCHRFWPNADGMLVQSTVGFRPFLGSRVTWAVRGLGPATHRFVSGGIFFCLVYYFASASQRQSADTIQRLVGAAGSLKD